MSYLWLLIVNNTKIKELSLQYYASHSHYQRVKFQHISLLFHFHLIINISESSSQDSCPNYNCLLLTMTGWLQAQKFSKNQWNILWESIGYMEFTLKILHILLLFINDVPYTLYICKIRNKLVRVCMCVLQRDGC